MDGSGGRQRRKKGKERRRNKNERERSSESSVNSYLITAFLSNCEERWSLLNLSRSCREEASGQSQSGAGNKTPYRL